MASAAVKTAAAILCVLFALSVAGKQLKTAASTSMCPDHVDDDDATLLGQLRELADDEARLAEELALLDAAGALCPGNCQKCLVKCAGSCVADIVTPPTFVACFLKCAVVNTCFLKK